MQLPYNIQTLVVLSPGFPENEADTTCLPLQQALLRSIKQQYPKLKVVVLAFQYPHKKQNYTWNGIRVEAFAGKGRSKLLRIYNWIKIWRALNKLKKTNEIAGILSFWMGECALVGEWFAKHNRLKHYCWVLGQDAKPENRYFEMMRPRGESLIALSDFISKTIDENYGVKANHVIPGGIDSIMFNAPAKKRDIDILGAGSLIGLKQYHLFIEVMCRLRRRFPNIKAVLCGDGPDKKRLERMIRTLHMEDHIILAGEVPHHEVLEMMQRSKVLLHTSKYEGLGMVCLEALYAGAKAVSFVRPMDRFIQNWYIAGTTMEMADIATDILQDPDTEYTRVAPYLIEDVAKQMVQLYVDNPATISLKRRAIAAKESVAV